jgi:hypothetical protein
MMKCPKCGGAQFCPCKNCLPNHPDEVVWKWDATGEIISCGHCGFSAHADSWADAGMTARVAETTKIGRP